MKKNITINLFGSLYAIDEDAYELLKKYEDNLKAYFCKQDGGEEIVDDIEHRIAELLEELHEKGVNAISIEHVQEIIRRIGNPDQMEGDEKVGEEKKQTQNEAGSSSSIKKKLFRDPTDCMLGGVMSGLAHYFGGEVLIWRLLIIGLCLFSKFIILPIYIICWIIIPKARTAEDFLLMNGKSVTPDNIGQTVMNGQNESGVPPLKRTGFNRFLAFCIGVLKVALYGLGVCFFVVCVLTFIATLVVLVMGVGGIVVSSNPLMYFGHDGITFLQNVPAGITNNFLILIVSSVFCCGIPIYCMVHHIMRIRKSVAPMGLLQRSIWIGAWIVSAVIISISGMLFVHNVNRLAYEDSNNVTLNTMDNDAWKKLRQQIGVHQLDSLNVEFVHGDEVADYKDESLCDVTPGIYRLRVRALADEEGCFIYVKGDDLLTETADVPDGTPGKVGNVISSVSINQNGIKVEKSKNISGKSGLNLPEVILDSIVIHKTSNVHYGITSGDDDIRNTFSGDNLVYIKDFVLEKIGDLPTQEIAKITKNKRKGKVLSRKK